MAFFSAIPTGLYVLLLFIACGTYVHFRGKVRHGFFRQMSDHSTVLAPVNCLLYLFSKLPAKPYHPVSQFPELALLRDNWQIIRDEALALDNQNRISASQALDDIGFNSFFRTGWKRFYLKWYGTDLNSAQRACPKTVALLRQIPSIKAAMFASLPPGATLVRHRDPYAGSMRYHLGLLTPEDPACAIYVDGQAYVWKDGQDVIFDETFIHHAENKTQKPRIVLFCDVNRPLWTPFARAFNALFGRVVVGAAATKNEAGDKIGPLNRVFAYAYKVREMGKKIKARSRPAYYAVKYCLFGLIIYALFF